MNTVKVNKCELIPTNTLEVGDYIFVDGCVFRVREVVVSEGHRPFTNGECHANYCDFIGLAAGYTCGMPVSCTENWNERGNSLARSRRITDMVL